MRRNTEKHKKNGALWHVLQAIAVLSLVYYSWMMVDLVTHPFATGSNAGPNPFLFRWLSALCGTITVVVAVFILRRVPGNFIGLLLVIFGVGAAGWSQRIDFGSAFANNMALIVFNIYFFFLVLPSLVTLLFYFPDGHIHPARANLWAWGFIFFQSVTGMVSILGSPTFQNGQIINAMFTAVLQPVAPLMNILMVLVAPLAAIVSLVLRYRASGEKTRLQIKWLVWLAGVAVFSSIGIAIVFPDGASSFADNLFFQLLRILNFIFWQIFPAAAIGISLLRHRLWDIDLVIRRTLLYSVLSGTFALLYFGSVVVFRQAFGGLTGKSNVAIVLSTLLVAALFEPVRRKVQTTIDQRFYRQIYDSTLALAEFSAQVRREVELENLTQQMINVVQKTVQPENISVWIRDPKPG